MHIQGGSSSRDFTPRHTSTWQYVRPKKARDAPWHGLRAAHHLPSQRPKKAIAGSIPLSRYLFSLPDLQSCANRALADWEYIGPNVPADPERNSIFKIFTNQCTCQLKTNTGSAVSPLPSDQSRRTTATHPCNIQALPDQMRFRALVTLLHPELLLVHHTTRSSRSHSRR